jgi:hypothetical protein
MKPNGFGATMEGKMQDLQADWRRWSRAEQVTAKLFGLALTMAAPALILLNLV